MNYPAITAAIALEPAELAGESSLAAPSLRENRAASQRHEELSKPLGSELSGHIPALDALRGLAIVMVTIYRFGVLGVDFTLPGMQWFELLRPLAKGVDLFFVLSGFLITGILADARSKPHYFRNFYARRSLRIFPLYYGTLLLFLIILPNLGIVPANVFPEANARQGWLWLYGTNLLQGWEGAWNFGAFNHFWSLAVEEHFYLVWPLIIFVTTRRQAMFVCGGLTLFSLVCRTLYTLGYGAMAADVGAETFTWMRLDSLCIGGWVALAARGPGGIRSLLPLAKWGILGSLGLLFMVSLMGQRGLHLPFTLFAIFFAGVLVVAVAASPESWLGTLGKNPILRIFGQYSYGMYVFQNLLIVLAANWISPAILTAELGSPAVGQLAYLASMFGLTTLIAVASWHLYEKRFMGLKKYFEASSRSPA